MKRSLAVVVGVVLLALLTLAAPDDGAAQTKTAFPEPGKAITIYVGFAAGGASDISARLLAAVLEKSVGTPVQVVVRPGASSQAAMAVVAHAKPDGYTLGQTVFPPFLTTYLDPRRGATYARKDFQAVAHYVFSAMALVVKADAPYRTLKDLLAAAKAAPEKIRVGTSGLQSGTHMMALTLERIAGAKFAYVHFRGSGEGIPAVLGGHVEVGSFGFPEAAPHHRNGAFRMLGSTEKGPNRFLPSVKTLVEQGYPVDMTSSWGLVVPAGTPKEVVEFLAKAVKKSVESDEFRDKAKAVGLTPDYMDTAEFNTYWTNAENQVRPLIELVK